MTGARCPRHPEAGVIGEHCAACLLDRAVAPAEEVPPEPAGTFTIQMPLGSGPSSAVYLVRGGRPWHRLLRLKRSHRPASDQFLARFAALQASLDAWSDPMIVRPVAAWLDRDGRAAMLTDFRPGVPLLDAFSEGWLTREAADAGAARVTHVVREAHARGLVHGSLVPGNVLISRGEGTPVLLDFGLSRAIGTAADDGGEAGDREALSMLAAAVHAPAPGQTRVR